MKKLLSFVAAASLAYAACAEDKEEEPELTTDIAQVADTGAPRKQVGVWPAFLAVSEIPSAS